MPNTSSQDNPSSQNEKEGSSVFTEAQYIEQLEGMVNDMALMMAQTTRVLTNSAQYMHPSAAHNVHLHNRSLVNHISGVRAKMLSARQKLHYVKE